jgi:undecaprenyl-diphosphatase
MILFDLIVHVGHTCFHRLGFKNSLKAYLKSTIQGFWEWISGEKTPMGGLYRRLTFFGLFSVFVTGIIGFPLKSMFESVFAQPLFMSGTLIITGIILWWTDYLPPRKVGRCSHTTSGSWPSWWPSLLFMECFNLPLRGVPR